MSFMRKDRITATLAAGVTQDFDIAMTEQDRYSIIIKNTGSNTIGTINVQKSPTGQLFKADAEANDALADGLTAGSSVLLEESECGYTVLRITLTSSAGTTVRIEARVE